MTTPPAVSERYPAQEIMPIAEELIDIMRPACQNISIAGSLRRGAETVKDIEIVAEPHLDKQQDLFGDPVGASSRLNPVLVRMIESGILSPAIKNGDRYKQFEVLSTALRPKLDLFVVRPPAQYGVILAIRTGPAEFSKRLVTSRYHGGLLPSHLHVKDGAVRKNANRHEVVPTPTEHDVFELLGIGWIYPEER